METGQIIILLSRARGKLPISSRGYYFTKFTPNEPIEPMYSMFCHDENIAAGLLTIE